MSSKQSGRKGSARGPVSRSVPGVAAGDGRPAGAPGAAGGSNSVPPKRAQLGTQTRSAANRQAKRGGKIRPLDIALLAGGVAVVALIIWGGLNAGKSTPGGDTGSSL